ncbi:molybdopterin synthase sulfur carrier subunit-like [Pomacea canaliculata]|uniref:molybdopterin synthase sulfur carrier subunit-like n=1 Tax=Pomacea canaliculata TaxID=400727 RepID=UPI000D72E4B1|nr:molybdopterin synthase sulfur carrier subunit-like [Pomacea canaliculata]
MERVLVRLLFFAKSREIVGHKEIEFEVDISTTPRLFLNSLLREYPGLSAVAQNIVLSLNGEYLDTNDQELILRTGDELAIIPPISGG